MSKEQHSPDDAPKPHWKAVEEAIGQHQQKHRQIRRVLRPTSEDSEADAKAPAELPVVYITDTLTRMSARLLAGAATKAPASVVYWFGFECGERAPVTTLIVPEKEYHSDSILASAVANEEVFSAIVAASLVFLGQVRLQDEDDTEEDVRDVRFEGAFSIEIPPGEPNGKVDLEKCRIYRQLDGECREIKHRQLDNHLRIIPGFKDLRKSNGTAPR